MAEGRIRERLRDPFAWVVVVALVVLTVIAGSSLFVRADVSEEAQTVTSEAVQVIGDAAAAQLVESSLPADLVLTALRSGIYADPTLLEPADVATMLATAMLSFDEVGSMQVEVADGTFAGMYRVEGGFAFVGRHADGTVEGIHFNSFFTAQGAIANPPSKAILDLEPVEQGEIVRGEPQPIGSERGLAVPSRLSVYDDDGELIATVQAAIDIDMLDEALADTKAVEVGQVAVYSPEGELIAGEDVQVPEDLMSTAVDEGSVAVDGNWVYYTRTVSTDSGLGWTLVLCASADEVVPSAAAVAHTMTFYTALVLILVAVFGAVAWVLRRPAGEISALARTDAVTGLANRHHFHVRGKDILAAAGRRGAHVLVVVFDLDGFKQVNDVIGHDAGDAALQIVGDALTGAAGPRDVVARTGGDEFALVHWLGDDEDASETVERFRSLADLELKACVDSEVVVGEIAVGVSAGWATTHGGERRLDRLVRAADGAMVEGRQDEKGTAYEAVPPASEH
ncbi:diguanylate cyclase [Demequina sp. NBRC 110054]|uniref:GGDEF domain-containing protein n=1 Tax=Demequina sp. NBRC 110054 TaxID=1570343 RepID=UPI0009FE268C|nr:diguanylate cyclase [Demequina sp. NBRC 110054]